MGSHTIRLGVAVLFLSSLTGCLIVQDDASTAAQEEGHAHCAARFHNSGDCDDGVFVDLSFEFSVNASKKDFEVNSGDVVSVSWEIGAGYRNCEIDPGNFEGNSGAFNSIGLTTDTTFRISCESSEGLEEREIEVKVRTSPPAPGGPQTVTFRIPATVTSVNQPWNTAGTAVNLKVGDTLQVFNDTNVPVQIHTNGNPFGHDSANIPQGGSRNYLIQSVCASNPCPNVYNHNGMANQGNFFLNVMP